MKDILLFSLIIALAAPCSNGEVPHSAMTKYDTAGLIDNYLIKLADEMNFSGGLLIVKNNKKSFSKGYGWANREMKIPFTPGTLASIGSITKAFTATAIMKLAEQNKLSLNDPLKKFFPSVPADKEMITVHQLLTHSSGFHEFLRQDGGDYEKIEWKEFLRRAFADPLAFTPGEKAVYTNVGMSLLGIIIEQVSGMDYEQFLRKNLFEPQGIRSIGYHYPVTANDAVAVGYQNGRPWGTHQTHYEQAGGGPYWNLKANGGLEASLDDMFLWINSFTKYDVLSKASITTMFTPHVPEEGYGGKSFFGYGCNISKTRRNTLMIDNGGSNGIYFARLLRLPEEGVVFYMVTNESSISTNMVLPNVVQLYFQGVITQDASARKPGFENKLSEQIYNIVERPSASDLGEELTRENIVVDDDMILLEVGEALIRQNKSERALILYKYYTKSFPNIVVAWNDLGDTYLALDKKEEAINCYRQALKLRPQNPRAKEALSKLGKP